MLGDQCLDDGLASAAAPTGVATGGDVVHIERSGQDFCPDLPIVHRAAMTDDHKKVSVPNEVGPVNHGFVVITPP